MKFPWTKKIEKVRTQTFSHTRLQELNDEHALVTQTIKRLYEARGRQIVHGLSPDIVVNVRANLLAKRAELELMIDVLRDTV